MVGENFEICWPQMARNEFKLSTMVGENFEICWLQMARNVFKLSTITFSYLYVYTHIKKILMRYLCDKNVKCGLQYLMRALTLNR